MKRIHVPVVAAAGLTIFACAGDSSGGLTGPETPDLSSTIIGVCNDDAPEPAFFNTNWDCGKTIRVRGPWSSAWNSALQHVRTPGVPMFADATEGGAFDLDVVVTGQDTVYCGHNVGFTRIEIGPPGSPACIAGASIGPLDDILMHEMGHVLGFQSGSHKSGTAGVSDECATELDQFSGPGSRVCQHVIEIIYAAYGYRSPIPADFWSKPIVTGVGLLGSNLTLEVNETDTIRVLDLRFSNSQTPSQPLGGVDLTFAAQKQDAVVDVNDSIVTGLAEGTDTIRIHIASGLNPAWQLGGFMATIGTQVPVTVMAPPPPPPGPFRVTDITGAPQPITGAGSYYLHATVANPPSGTTTIRWRIEYSIGPDGDPLVLQTGWYPNSYRLDVHPGSYNIRVTATPRDIDGFPTGSAFTENFPVCTGGGGGGGGGPWLVDTDPGGETDAKQGCG